MVKKVTISLPDELLASLDAEAASLDVTRSGIVQEASAHYLRHTREEREATERRARAERVMSGFAALAALPSLDDRPSSEVLREVRGHSDSTPVPRPESGR
jgi:predicted transcriptional regulator